MKPAIFTKVSNLYLPNAPLPSICKNFIFPKSFCLYSFYFVLCFISCLLQTFLALQKTELGAVFDKNAASKPCLSCVLHKRSSTWLFELRFCQTQLHQRRSRVWNGSSRDFGVYWTTKKNKKKGAWNWSCVY